jgi:polyhydroxyalkanoate synthesis regulator phasin
MILVGDDNGNSVVLINRILYVIGGRDTGILHCPLQANPLQMVFKSTLSSDQRVRFGGNIRRRTRNGNQHLIIQYRCAKYYNHKCRTCGNNKVLNENVLERHILAHIRPDIENVILSAETRQKPANDAKKRVQALSKKLDKLKELFLNDLISLEEYKVTREEIMTEMEDLKRIPMPVNTNIDRLRMILKMDIEGTYQKMNKEEKRNFWRGIIKEIRFGRDRKIEIIFLD